MLSLHPYRCVYENFLHFHLHTVKVEVHAEYVLSQLLQKELFSIARKYANIVNSTASKVTVKKVSVCIYIYTYYYCVSSVTV